MSEEKTVKLFVCELSTICGLRGTILTRLIRHRCHAVVLLLISLPAGNELFAQGVEYVQEHYTKSEHMVPMRDGTRLFTIVYAPKDQSQKYPIMLFRTPYSVGPYGAENFRSALGPSADFARGGFIFAYQDVRGQFKSEGDFVVMRPIIADKRDAHQIDESSDTY